MVKGFQVQSVQPQAPALTGMVTVCGACGALIADGFESRHFITHNNTWSAQSLTTRTARGPHEANNP
jgi:hypothetical protein